jgi:hypothetical protein
MTRLSGSKASFFPGPFHKNSPEISGLFFVAAEREGFEPPGAVTPQRFSRPPQSTTLPSLRGKSTNIFLSENKKLKPFLFIQKVYFYIHI